MIVIFRRGASGEVVALFPDVVGLAACLHVIFRSRPATIEEPDVKAFHDELVALGIKPVKLGRN